MRAILTILLIFVAAAAFSQVKYYVKTGGSDAAAGTSDATAWATISKVNSTVTASDSVYFKRGDTFTGQLVPVSGSSSLKTFYGAYGSGARPIISGFTTLSGWTNLGSNKWEKAVNSGSTLNVVTVSGVHTAMGRYPNYPTQLAYENSTANTNIIDNDLPTSPSWAGATAVLRSETWALNNLVNITHTASGGGSQLSSATPYSLGNVAHNGNGYFIQNHINTLDAQNEWYYTPSTKITIYSTTDPGSTVKVATTEDLISIVSKNYITIRDLRIEGADRAGIWLQSASNISIINCDIEFVGTSAITNYDNFTATAVSNITVDSCIIHHCNSNAVYIGGGSGTNTNTIITHNIINNCGMLPGMGEPDSDHLDGIFTRCNGTLIQYNTIDSVGGSCISVFDRNWTVDKNFCAHWNFLIDDIGGIYSSHCTNADPGSGTKQITNNIVINGFPTPAGKAGMQPQCEGIYTDTPEDNVTIAGNTVYNVNHNGIFTHYSFTMTVRDNTVYNAGNAQYAMWTEGGPQGGSYPISGMQVKNNILVSRTNTQKTAQYYHPDGNTSTAWGTLDSNWHVQPFRKAGYINMESFNSVAFSTAQDSYDAATWKALSSQEAHSNPTPINLAAYTVTSVIGSNKAATTSYTWSGSPGYVEVGTVTSGTKYRVQLTSSAVSTHSNLRILFMNSDPTTGGTIIYSDEGFARLLTTTSSEEFVLTATVTGLARLYLYCPSPVTHTVSSIDVHEVTTTIPNPDDSVYFAYNATSSPVTIDPPGSHYWKDGPGTRYADTKTLQPFTSTVLLMDTGTIVSNLPPVVSAGVDKVITLPTTSVSVTGTASDPDGTIASTLWSQISGPNTAGISAATSLTTSFTGLIAGVYQMKFTGTDNLGASASDTMQVTVNIAPIASAGTDIVVQLPATSTTLNGSGSTDADGTITTYAWVKLTGTGGTITTPAAASTTVTGLSAGGYTYKLTVTDNNGATSTDTVSVTVNIQPVARAGTDVSIQLPVSSTGLSGSTSTDADGTIASYAWVKLTGTGGSISGASTATPTVSGLTAGTYTYQLTVTDNLGGTGKDTVQVNVQSANIDPVANAGGDATIVPPASTYQLDGSASYDPDGTITAYAWTKLSGPAYSINNAGIVNPLLSILTTGVYVFRLMVTDNNGATNTDTITITVGAASLTTFPVQGRHIKIIDK